MDASLSRGDTADALDLDLDLDRRAPPPFWNGEPFRTYLFDAFSVLLPAGEQFVIDAVADAMRALPPSSRLWRDGARFVEEERSHQRAHRMYNDRLEAEGHAVKAEEARMSREMSALQSRLTLSQRLCLAAAFEHLTAGISVLALRRERVLVRNGTRQSRLWQWHCAEETGHADVAPAMLSTRRVSMLARTSWFLLAALWLGLDVLRLVWRFYRTDVARHRIGAWTFWRDVASFTLRGIPDLVRLAVHGISFLVAPTRAVDAIASPATRGVEVRLLTTSDLPDLLRLEHRCWTPEQAATEAALRWRMRHHPSLCLGAFCTQTGTAVASLFMKPMDGRTVSQAATWNDCARAPEPRDGMRATNALFGISLSSCDPGAVTALMQYFWPRAVRAGWRHIYLGSPIPGLRAWLEKNPGGDVGRYVQSRRRGLPADPQLRYYHQRGFTRIVAVRAGYFPHERSLDHGVLLRGTVPGARWAALWRRVPWRLLEWVSERLFGTASRR